MKKIHGRRLDPAAVDGGLFRDRYLPVPDEAPEVIDTDEIDESHGVADALHPPVVLRLPQHLPAVMRVAPALAGRAEVVRGNTCDREGTPFRVQVEELPVRPDIGTVTVHVDGYVADEAHAMFAGVVLHGGPLP